MERLLLLTYLLSVATTSDAKTALKIPEIKPLKIISEYTIPVKEISGLAWRKNPKSKNTELVVVGDREHTIYVIDWQNRAKGLELHKFPLKKFPSLNQSEWESIFCDESGRVYIVQERPAQVLIVSSDLSTIEGTISLNFQTEGNSGSEGIMPLRNGHFLVVKEKDPIQIIEFASKNSKPLGYDVSLSIERSGVFPVPKGNRNIFYQAYNWSFSTVHEKFFEDSSGINVDKTGNLFLLSDQKNMIAAIGNKLSTKNSQVQIEKLWSLPSRIKRAEGMVIDDANHPVIAIDKKKTKKPNLFILSPLQ